MDRRGRRIMIEIDEYEILDFHSENELEMYEWNPIASKWEISEVIDLC